MMKANTKGEMRKENGAKRRTPYSVLRDRRGVLLLVVLGMLTLFLMIGTAFVISSNQYRRANKTYSRIGERESQRLAEEDFLGEVINQIIRDTTNINSALRFHSLLRDLYGADGFRGEVNAPLLDANFVMLAAKYAGARAGTTDELVYGPTVKQFIEFSVYDSPTNPTDPDRPKDLIGNNYTLRTTPDHYAGQLLTWTTGPMAGKSSRIVKYRYEGTFPSGRGIFTVVALPTTHGAPLLPFRGTANSTRSPELSSLANIAEGTNPGAKFVVNGRPFNGTGVGYNPLAGANQPKLNTEETVPTMAGNVPGQIALMPNAAFFVPVPGTNVAPEYFSSQWASLTALQQQSLLTNMGLEGQGGSDESYDAPDYQNMFLAWTGPNVQDTIFTDLSGTPIDSVTYDQSNPPPFLGNIVLPSFHRPDLLNYWYRQIPDPHLGTAERVSLLRKVMLRPNWHDHPDFDGSNPEYAMLRGTTFEGRDRLLRMIYGPWDVDNDNDGVRDSVWVDFGAPVMIGRNGKLVKPLAAIMVVDLDGRLNVNAHSTRELAGLNGGPDPVPMAGGVSSNNVPRGQAFGPADINLGVLLGDRHDNVVGGGTFHNKSWLGRYSNDEEPGVSNRFDLSAQLKFQGFPLPNMLSRSNFGTMPDLRSRYSMGLNDFGQSITDFVATEDDRRNLVEDNPYEMDLSTTGQRGQGSHVDNPYSPAELERVLRAYDVDAGTLPPRLFELLKGNDTFINVDRLKEYRTLLTTDSYDLPEPSFQLPEWVRAGLPGVASSDYVTVMGRQPINATYADLIEYRIRAAQTPIWNVAADTPARLQTIQRTMRMLIAPEMLAGLKLDLNRPLGNGRDDNNNGVVDEPGEEEGKFWDIAGSRMSANEAGYASRQIFEDDVLGKFRDCHDLDGNGQISADEQLFSNPTDFAGRVNLHNYRRQLFARHLYVLAMAVTDPLGELTSPTPEQVTEHRKNLLGRAMRLAQWAINVVDYRDADNIMTAFEFDANPFDGWNVDDNISTTDDWHGTNGLPGDEDDMGGVVWGAERPELLITETLAWHDRATMDLTTEDPVNFESDKGNYQNHAGLTVAGGGGTIVDTDYDQRFRPQGAAFIELYNPWGPSPGANADTHRLDGNGNDLGVDLAKTHNNDPLTGSPVWRIAAYRSRATEKLAGSNLPYITGAELYSDPDHPEVLYRPLPENPTTVRERELLKRILRCVYFTGQDPVFLNTNIPDGGVPYVNSVQLPTDPPVSEKVDNPVPPVRPGRYMVVGSGDPIGGGTQYLAKFGEPQSPGSPSRGIILDTNPSTLHAVRVVTDSGAGTPVTDQAGFPVEAPSEGEASGLNMVPNSIPNFASTASVAIIDQSYRPSTSGPVVERRRFSLSEPAKGYPRLVNNSSLGSNNQYSPVVDIPLDDQRGTFATDTGTGLPIVNFAKWTDAELQNDQMTDREDRLRLPLYSHNPTTVKPEYHTNANVTRTIPAFSVIYLQRLANPLLPYNRVTNPYLTIDSMGANVTVFNGRETREIRWRTEANIADAWWVPRASEALITDKDRQYYPKVAEMDYNSGNAVAAFSSVQRGRENNPDPDERYSVSYDPTGFSLGTIEKVQAFMRQRNTTDNNSIKPPNSFVPPVGHNLWNPELIGGRRIAPGSLQGRLVGVWRNAAGPTGNGTLGGSYFFKGAPDCTLGFMNEPFRRATVSPVADRLVPTGPATPPTPWMAYPFPSIAWNNRPFANPGELLNVPAYRSSELLKMTSYAVSHSANSNIPKQEVFEGDLYDGMSAPDPKVAKIHTEFPYRHLLNFFRTEIDTDASNQANNKGFAGLHKILDLVTVESRYVGTETWLNPQAFGNVATPVTSTADPRYGFQPPFNKIPARREPGKVNINTIASGGVWQALFHGSAKRHGRDGGHPAIDDDYFAPVRRGYGRFNDSPYLLNNNRPSIFTPFGATLDNVFYGSTSGLLMRCIGEPVVRTTAGALGALPTPAPPFTEDDRNRYSEDPQIPSDSNVRTEPDNDSAPFLTAYSNLDSYVLLTSQTTDGAPPENPGYRHQFRDSDKNSKFRYSPFARATALTTNRSNVFAVWVTVGFFEVDELDETNTMHQQILARFGTGAGTLADARQDPLFQRVYPDGYRFGKEAGIDTGETRRLREFAIVDRTIPAGFEPGANHNSGETIRLRRKIE